MKFKSIIAAFLLVLAAGSFALAAAPATYSALSFGSRLDVATWTDGMRTKLGATEGMVLRATNADATVPLPDLIEFWKRSDEWLYLTGHSGGGNLFNRYPEAPTIVMTFSRDGIEIKHGTQTVKLRKGIEFNQHKKLKGIIWGGCSLHQSPADIAVWRELFGPNVLYIGFVDHSGWQMNQLIMGGSVTSEGHVTPGATEHFFRHLSAASTPSDMKDAWLKAADSLVWGRPVPPDLGRPFRARFSVILPGGVEWGLRNPTGTAASQGIVTTGRTF